MTALRGPAGNPFWANVVISSVHDLDGKLRGFAQITRNLQLTSETLALDTLVTHAVEAAHPLLDSKRHSLEIDRPKHHLWVRGDPTRLTQVFVNLLNNAAKYTPEGGRLEVRLRTAGNTVSVHVRDNGVGIEAELLPRMFDLFTQGARPLDRTDGGLGVGLAPGA